MMNVREFKRSFISMQSKQMISRVLNENLGFFPFCEFWHPLDSIFIGIQTLKSVEAHCYFRYCGTVKTLICLKNVFIQALIMLSLTCGVLLTIFLVSWEYRLNFEASEVIYLLQVACYSCLIID